MASKDDASVQPELLEMMGSIRTLMRQEQWDACILMIGRMFAGSGNLDAFKAELNYASCVCYSAKEEYVKALEPGQRAVILAEQAGDFDLLGKAILALAWTQHRAPGMAPMAVHTQQRYFAEFERWSGDVRQRYLGAMFNLGAYFRAAGEHREALDQFRKAYDAARARKESDWADRCRRNAAWEALELRQLDLAEELMAEGREYAARHGKDPRTAANYFLNDARLQFLKGDHAEASGLAVEAALAADGIPELIAEAFDILHQVGKATGEIEGALALAVLAKNQAEENERPDIVARIRASVREMAIRFPEAVTRFMNDLTTQV